MIKMEIVMYVMKILIMIKEIEQDSYFKPRDNVKYFDKKESPANISDIEEYQEKNEVEEFDYNIENFTAIA